MQRMSIAAYAPDAAAAAAATHGYAYKLYLDKILYAYPPTHASKRPQ